MQYAIDVHQLNKHFGDRHAVRDLSLQVNTGEIYGFLGPNGSGKTTSIRMLCGLLTPDSGSGSCLGFNVTTQSAEIKREVGYMTQRFSLWEDLSIGENLDFIARMYSTPNRAKTVTQTLDELGLAERRNQLAGSLSGGWKQRLALAACLLHQPKLLLLDEPTAGVDPQARRDFWAQIHRLATQGVTVLVSTHYMDEAERCHRLAYMANGSLLASGTVDEVVAGQHLFAWEITGDDLYALAETLEKHPDVSLVTPFGNALHVLGTHSKKLAAAVKSVTQKTHQAKQVEPNLEDAFISLLHHKPEADA